MVWSASRRSSPSWPPRISASSITLLYTDYAKSKGQSLASGINIIFDLSIRPGGESVLIVQVLLLLPILRPSDVTWVANRIGVGRGTDLLLYCLAIAFFAWAVNTYVRFRNLEARFAELVRAVALQKAEPPSEKAVTSRNWKRLARTASMRQPPSDLCWSHGSPDRS